MTPDEVDEIRERYDRWTRSAVLLKTDHGNVLATSTEAWITGASGLARDVPALLAALAEAQRERDEARRERDEYHSRCEKLRADFGRLRTDRDGWERLYVEARGEVQAAQRREELMRPVVEAAKAFRHQEPGRMTGSHALFAAVDTYETQENTE